MLNIEHVRIPEIIERWLVEHKCDGLRDLKRGCKCRLGDLFPCEEFDYLCTACRNVDGELKPIDRKGLNSGSN